MTLKCEKLTKKLDIYRTHLKIQLGVDENVLIHSTRFSYIYSIVITTSCCHNCHIVFEEVNLNK